MISSDAVEHPRVLSLAERPAGAALMGRCVDDAAPRRGALARLIGSDPLGAHARDLFAAVVGEQEVARRLGQLDREWTVLNSLPLGGDEVDHVVIGRRGVFALIVASVPGRRARVAAGRLRVAGREVDDLRRAFAVRESVAARIGVAVGHTVPVFVAVVVVGAEQFRRVAGDSAPVLRPDELERWFAAHPEVMSLDAAGEVAAAAQSRSTWRFEEVAQAEERQVFSSFERLHDEVARAARRRSLLAVASIALVSCALLAGALLGIPHGLGVSLAPLLAH